MMISTRTPPCTIEYDCKGKRVTKFFEDSYKGRAFFASKLKLGLNPKVVKPSDETRKPSSNES